MIMLGIDFLLVNKYKAVFIPLRITCDRTYSRILNFSQGDRWKINSLCSSFNATYAILQPYRILHKNNKQFTHNRCQNISALSGWEYYTGRPYEHAHSVSEKEMRK